MNNKHLWWDRSLDYRHRPILMVCYTNHALDQFLENCIEKCGLTNRVVRVGGQSRSHNLDDFKLTNIKSDKRNLNRRLKLDDTIHSRVETQRGELSFLRDQINNISLGIKQITNRLGLLNFNVLENFIDELHVGYFKAGNIDPNINLLKWLGFFDDELNEHETSDSNKNLNEMTSIEDLFSNFNIDDTRQDSNLCEDLEFDCQDLSQSSYSTFEGFFLF